MSAIVANAKSGGLYQANNSTPVQTTDNNRLKVGSETDAESPSESVPKIPDGGWGWVVVFGSFLIHVIADGIMYSFGVLVEDFVDYFHCTKSEIGGVGSLMLGVTWGSGDNY